MKQSAAVNCGRGPQKASAANWSPAGHHNNNNNNNIYTGGVLTLSGFRNGPVKNIIKKKKKKNLKAT